MSMETWAATKKSSTLVWWCHELLSGSLPNVCLFWVSHRLGQKLFALSLYIYEMHVNWKYIYLFMKKSLLFHYFTSIGIYSVGSRCNDMHINFHHKFYPMKLMYIWFNRVNIKIVADPLKWKEITLPGHYPLLHREHIQFTTYHQDGTQQILKYLENSSVLAELCRLPYIYLN